MYVPMRQREDAEARIVAARALRDRIGRPVAPPPKPVPLDPYGCLRPLPDLSVQEQEMDRLRYLLGRKIFAADVIEIVSRRSGFSPRALVGHSRNSELVRPRHEISWLVRALTSLSLPALGRVMDRDHSTILYGARQFAALHGLPAPEQAPRELALRILEHGAGE